MSMAATSNFERQFTPRTSLRSPRNFGDVRFRRFANFDFLTPMFFFRFGKKISFFFPSLLLFLADFRGARFFLTSKSSSSRFFASDGQIFRSVRRLGLIFRFFTVRTSTCGEIYDTGRDGQTTDRRRTKKMGARHGRCRGKARLTEIPEGGSAPADRPPGARHE